MKTHKLLQILANETRLNILHWLSDPKKYFSEESKTIDKAAFEDGVCAALIKRKSELSQSTTSQYMALLETAGLVTSSRHGKWTHYERNEEAIKKLLHELKTILVLK